MNFGKALKTVRLVKGLSQKEAVTRLLDILTIDVGPAL